jgi:hypothetical protein
MSMLFANERGTRNGRELKNFKIVYKINWPAGAPRSPKAFKYGPQPHTPLKGTSTLENPDASRCAPALNHYVFVRKSH